MNTIIKKIFKPREQSLKEAIEDLIEDHDDENGQNGEEITDSHERALISNILKLQEETVEDVMVPRADIIAVEESKRTYGCSF